MSRRQVLDAAITSLNTISLAVVYCWLKVRRIGSTVCDQRDRCRSQKKNSRSHQTPRGAFPIQLAPVMAPRMKQAVCRLEVSALQLLGTGCMRQLADNGLKADLL
ncbi:hypothetical protein [Bradyrhizobium sp. SSUT112]|uniref:hypothetical protein n=1 Tax=Bradyrhizobium sp. SSUT112 TaxID=3040604 RepID=UPI0024484D3D|nr:hypothetical protein [Bradyrhizobium sp. SSUT112]